MLFEAVDETEGTKRLVTQGGLPALTGAPAVVEKALKIRSRILVEADDVLSRLRSDEMLTEVQRDTAITAPRPVSESQVHAAEMALNRLRGQVDGNWWADHAQASAADLLAALMEQLTIEN